MLELLAKTVQTDNQKKYAKKTMSDAEFFATEEGKKVYAENYGADVKSEYKGKDLSTDSDAYDYDFLVRQPNMHVPILPPLSSVKDANGINRDIAVTKGMENAAAVGNTAKMELLRLIIGIQGIPFRSAVQHWSIV